MGFNRLADHAIDARNPRTAARELPRGVLSRGRGRGRSWRVSAAAFVLAAAMLNPLCLVLSPVALAIVFGYSYTKRFTAPSHLVLGLSLAIAPVGAWLAIRGRFEPVPLVLGLAVVLWVAGFDTIYACQDVDFDRREGLHSMPARLGVRARCVLARGLHVAAIAAAGRACTGSPRCTRCTSAAWRSVAALLAWEHSLVRRRRPRRVDAALHPERLGERRLLRVHRRGRLAGLKRRAPG